MVKVVVLSMEPRDIFDRAHQALQNDQTNRHSDIRALVWAHTEPPTWQKLFPGLMKLEAASEIWVLQQVLSVYYEARCFYLDEQGRVSYQSWLCERMRALIKKLHPNDSDERSRIFLAYDL